MTCSQADGTLFASREPVDGDCCWIGDETCPVHGAPICCGEPMSIRHVYADGSKSWECHICTKRELTYSRKRQ